MTVGDRRQTSQSGTLKGPELGNTTSHTLLEGPTSLIKDKMKTCHQVNVLNTIKDTFQSTITVIDA